MILKRSVAPHVSWEQTKESILSFFVLTVFCLLSVLFRFDFKRVSVISL